jgi:hypothetical protein
VRAEHAAFNRTVRDWADSPDPGEEFNCRCWQMPIKTKKHDCQQLYVDWENARLTTEDARQNWDKAKSVRDEKAKAFNQAFREVVIAAIKAGLEGAIKIFLPGKIIKIADLLKIEAIKSLAEISSDLAMALDRYGEASMEYQEAFDREKEADQASQAAQSEQSRRWAAYEKCTESQED